METPVVQSLGSDGGWDYVFPADQELGRVEVTPTIDTGFETDPNVQQPSVPEVPETHLAEIANHRIACSKDSCGPDPFIFLF